MGGCAILGIAGLLEAMELNNRPRKRSSIVTRRVVGETVLVPVQRRLGEQHCIYTLNEVGALVWERADGRATLEELIGELVAVFEITREEAERDVRAFVETLVEERLLEIAPLGEPV